MPTIEWNDLEQAYNSTGLEPNLIVITNSAYKWLSSKYAPGMFVPEEPKPDFWETDDFVTWGRALYQEARQPKNSTLRQFLGTNRWERRKKRS